MTLILTLARVGPHPSAMPRPIPKNLGRPDESVRLPGVEEDLVHLGDEIVARVVQHPGWRWSSDMRAIAGGRWCETRHVGVTLSGRQGVELRDGTVLEFGPDDAWRELIGRHVARVRGKLADFRGTEVDLAGDGPSGAGGLGPGSSATVGPLSPTSDPPAR